jgi:hypothetical protein
MAAALSAALGKTVRYNGVPPAVFRSFGFPGADDLGNMFQIYDEFAAPLNATRDVARSKALNPALQDFSTWLAGNASRIPLD